MVPEPVIINQIDTHRHQSAEMWAVKGMLLTWGVRNFDPGCIRDVQWEQTKSPWKEGWDQASGLVSLCLAQCLLCAQTQF